MRNVVLVGALSVLLAACGGPKFDASSEESRKESVERMKQALPEGERGRFERAVTIVAMDGLGLEDLADGGGSLDAALASLDGKSAEEIMQEADAIIAAREAREREQALQEIAELEQRVRDAEAAKQELAKFTINRSRFHLQYDRYSVRPEPILELSMTNGTDQAVGRVFAVGTIASPGRTIPWLIEDFNFSVSGGIEPGEEYETRLNPNMFSEWGKVRPPSDAVFTVEVVELEKGDGERFLSIIGLREFEQERLQQLKDQFK